MLPFRNLKGVGYFTLCTNIRVSDMDSKQKTIYLPWEMKIVVLQDEDVVRTSYVDDNNGGWDDGDASPIGDNF